MASLPLPEDILQMTPQDFERWLLHLNSNKRRGSMVRGCRLLGITEQTGRRYRDGINPIPRHVALACSALVMGLRPYGEYVFDMAPGPDVTAWSR